MSEPTSDRIPRVAWAVVAAVGVLVLWIVAPEAIRATFSSPGTFLRVAAVTLVLVVFGRLVGRFVPNRTAATVIRIVPVLAVSWWALSPYVSPSEVDEAFPVVTADATTTSSTTTTTTEAPASTAPGETTTTAAPTTTTTTAPPEPVLLRSGSFQGLTGHRGSGTASIYDLPDGSRLLRLENLDTGPGPDLDVYLVPRADARGLGDAIRIADLTAQRGNQNYDVPTDLDVMSGEWTVLIWCQSFAVEVSNATLT